MRISKFVLLFFFCLSFNLQASGNLNIEEVTTRKGFKFLFVESHDLPKVSLNISFKDAGYAHENAEKQGLTWFTSLVKGLSFYSLKATIYQKFHLIYRLKMQVMHMKMQKNRDLLGLLLL